MADLGNKLEISEKPRSFFNRSFSVYTAASIDSPQKPYAAQSPLDRAGSGSFRKFYNSMESVKGKVKKLCNIFETPRPTSLSPTAQNNDDPPQPQSTSKLKSTKSMGHELRFSNIWNSIGSSTIRLPGAEDRIVVYLTSLRGIRRTYEDCYSVRMIFRGFRVWIDERDISMDSAYKKELQDVLGEKHVSLPHVFIRGRYVGGAEAIKQLFETGELAKILEGFPIRQPGSVCDGCGDVRFVPCGNCSGSRKLFDEDEGLLKRCLECNENGLIRCPDCCS